MVPFSMLSLILALAMAPFGGRMPSVSPIHYQPLEYQVYTLKIPFFSHLRVILPVKRYRPYHILLLDQPVQQTGTPFLP